MCSDDESFQVRFDAALSWPESAQRFLYVYWLAATEWLKRSRVESILSQLPPLMVEGSPEWVCSAEDTIAKCEMLMERIRRIEGYLGHAPCKINPKALENAKNHATVKLIRAAVQAGWSDESIESVPSNIDTRMKTKRGRPVGTVDLDGQAVIALTLHESDPIQWSYPRLADEFFKCTSESDTVCVNEFGKHAADSVCVNNLKKAVARLSEFLQELGYKPTGK